jgi:hypothetical protein
MHIPYTHYSPPYLQLSERLRLLCLRVNYTTWEPACTFRDFGDRARSGPMSDTDTHLHLSPRGFQDSNLELPIFIRWIVACLEKTSDVLSLRLDACFPVAFGLAKEFVQKVALVEYELIRSYPRGGRLEMWRKRGRG